MKHNKTIKDSFPWGYIFFFRILLSLLFLNAISVGATSINVDSGDLSDLPILSAVGRPKKPLPPKELADFIQSHPAAEAGDEYLPLLLSLLKTTHPGRSIRVTQVKAIDPARWEPVQDILPVLGKSGNPKIRALTLLINNTRNPQSQGAAATESSGAFSGAAALQAALTAKDDWEAFAFYQTAGREPRSLTDEQLLQAIDPARPSLAAAVLEDRFGEDYLQKELPSVTSLNLEPETRTKILKKCLDLKTVEEPRILLPVLHTLILLGRAEYLQEYIILSTHQVPEIRGLAYLGLMRFSDTSLFRYFLAGLKDENNDVRDLSIKGLGALRDARGIDPLAAILNDPEENLFLRLAAAKALGEIGDRRIGKAFTKILLLPADDRGFDTAIRIEAARNVGRLREKSAVEALLANIDPQGETQLNYECLLALGKINSVTGFKKLIPLVEQGISTWTATGAPHSNLYAALWALFLHHSDETLSLFRQILGSEEKVPNHYDPCAYVAVWHLSRRSHASGPGEGEEYENYLGVHRKRFFAEQRRVYHFCMLLPGQLEEENLAFFSENITNYDDAVKTWVLSALAEQPSFFFLSALEQLYSSSGRSVRLWTASVLQAISRMISGKDREEGETIKEEAERIINFIDRWEITETDNRIKTDLSKVRNRMLKLLER